jgi:hypothetical protein
MSYFHAFDARLFQRHFFRRCRRRLDIFFHFEIFLRFYLSLFTFSLLRLADMARADRLSAFFRQPMSRFRHISDAIFDYAAIFVFATPKLPLFRPPPTFRPPDC